MLAENFKIVKIPGNQNPTTLVSQIQIFVPAGVYDLRKSSIVRYSTTAATAGNYDVILGLINCDPFLLQGLSTIVLDGYSICHMQDTARAQQVVYDHFHQVNGQQFQLPNAAAVYGDVITRKQFTVLGGPANADTAAQAISQKFNLKDYFPCWVYQDILVVKDMLTITLNVTQGAGGSALCQASQNNDVPLIALLNAAAGTAYGYTLYMCQLDIPIDKAPNDFMHCFYQLQAASNTSHNQQFAIPQGAISLFQSVSCDVGTATALAIDNNVTGQTNVLIQKNGNLLIQAASTQEFKTQCQGFQKDGKDLRNTNFLIESKYSGVSIQYNCTFTVANLLSLGFHYMIQRQ